MTSFRRGAAKQVLLEWGKVKKVALVACMRKLLVIMHTMVKNGTTWNPDLHPSCI